MKVLITGAGGQLASALLDGFAGVAEVRAFVRADLDITDTGAVDRQVAAFEPDVIINGAAYNHVDLAETQPADAMVVNALAVRALARAAHAAGATLVHYSTDFVFDGRASRPYVEDDQPNPQSVYAASKLLGEWFAREAPRAFVLRVESLFGGLKAHSSIDRIADSLSRGLEARVFVDRTVSPSFVSDVVVATRALLERGEPGLYHCVGSGYCTWYELAQEAARLMGCEARLVPVSVNDVPLPAARPQFGALSNAKLLSAGIAMPSWQDALARYLRARQDGTLAERAFDVTS